MTLAFSSKWKLAANASLKQITCWADLCVIDKTINEGNKGKFDHRAAEVIKM